MQNCMILNKCESLYCLKLYQNTKSQFQGGKIYAAVMLIYNHSVNDAGLPGEILRETGTHFPSIIGFKIT